MILKTISTALISVVTVGLLVFAQQLPPGATVKGRVIYEDTGLPLRRAWVGLRELPGPESGNSNVEYYSDTNSNGFQSEYLYEANASANLIDGPGELVLTDDNGKYEFRDVSPGVYQPFVEQAGIRNPTIEDVNDPNYQQITVFGADTIDVDITVKRGGSIEGAVKYVDGSPALGVLVLIQSAENEPLELRTDDRGIYRVAGLAEGDYYVSVSEPVVHDGTGQRSFSIFILEHESRQSMLKVYYPGELEEKKATPVAVSLGIERTGIDITIPNFPFARVSGIVSAKNDQRPLPDAAVSFRRVSDDESSRTNIVFSDKNGQFSLDYLLPGKYEIEVEQTSRFGPPPDAILRGRKLASVHKEIEIQEGENEDIVFELPFAASISGTVEMEDNKTVEQNLTAFAVNTEDYDYDRGYIENTDNPNLSEFLIDDMHAGNFALNVTGRNVYVKSVMWKGQEFADKSIPVAEGEEITGVQIIVSTNVGILKGRIQDNGDFTVWEIFLVPKDIWDATGLFAPGRILVERVGANRTFEFQAKPGSYYLVTREPLKDSDTTKEPSLREFFEELIKDAEIIELRAGKTLEKSVVID